MEQNQTEPIEYEKPAIVDYGELTELTAATGAMKRLDHGFPTSTPFSSLTFS